MLWKIFTKTNSSQKALTLSVAKFGKTTIAKILRQVSQIHLLDHAASQ
jgi:hypothetical protein